ncbi:MAG: hypothetical protein JJLCMIEE_01704 [Acidimicrobiales bacterium]|nr:MAG: GYD domain-containing protein [Actinomycetota bacterium]MBV6508639.1 hypothetical protein [Acidimicrobiales bacterium]RIK08084.1 MAG: GYD domain protein [Acidobacteriota bacterium]
MPKYLYTVSYTSDGVRGLLKEGGSSRRSLIEHLAKDLGGKLESFYYAFGNDDVFAIVDLPDDETAAAIALTIGASGAIEAKTTVLLTPEQVDAATEKSIAYRPPGG